MTHGFDTWIDMAARLFFLLSGWYFGHTFPNTDKQRS